MYLDKAKQRMPFKSKTLERRKHPRYTINTEASLKKCPHCLGLGPLVDVSMGGISFQYETNEKELDLSTIDIYFGNDIFVIENIPCHTIVSDTQKDNETATLSNGVKRIGIKFGTLSQKLKKQLTFLIQLNLMQPDRSILVS